MGLRFRRSVKIAPGVKLNFNKKSVGVTLGGKGAHYTVNSKGKRTSTVGIPGTGLSYTTSSGDVKADKSSSRCENFESGTTSSNGGGKKKKHGCLTVFIAIFVLCIIGSALSGDKKLESVSISADTSKEYDINEVVTITAETSPDDFKLTSEDYKCSADGNIDASGNTAVFTSSEAGEYEVWIDKDDVTSNVITITIIDKDAEEAKKQAELEAQKQAEETQKKAEEEAEAEQVQKQEAEQSQEPQEEMVWIPSSGSKYHSNSSCSGMTNPRQVTLSDAESMGYTPCKKCH